MCPDIASGSVGPETTYDVAFSAGALTASVKYAGTQASGSMALTISGAQIIDALAAKTTNPVEKELLQGLAAIIAAIP